MMYSFYHRDADSFIRLNCVGGRFDITFDTICPILELDADDLLLLSIILAGGPHLYDSPLVKAMSVKFTSHCDLRDVIAVEDGDFLNAKALSADVDDIRSRLVNYSGNCNV